MRPLRHGDALRVLKRRHGKGRNGLYMGFVWQVHPNGIEVRNYNVAPEEEPRKEVIKWQDVSLWGRYQRNDCGSLCLHRGKPIRISDVGGYE